MSARSTEGETIIPQLISERQPRKMAVPIDIDFHLFEVGEKKVKEMIDFMGRQPAR